MAIDARFDCRVPTRFSPRRSAILPPVRLPCDYRTILAAVHEVAVAWLLGYCWLAERGLDMRLADEAHARVECCGGLRKFVSTDEIFRLIALRGESSGGDLLRRMPAIACRSGWPAAAEYALLAASFEDCPHGQAPDIDDGVCINVPPFMSLRLSQGDRTSTGILHHKPGPEGSRDRRREPAADRPCEDSPRFQVRPGNSAQASHTGLPDGPGFVGNRWNGLHTNTAKFSAREREGHAGRP